MVRSAAKNHAHVAIVTDPADYAALLAELDANGGSTTLELRKQLAAKAYALPPPMTSTISQWFAFADQGERFPRRWTVASKLKMPLRYGENPHQQAALYAPGRAGGARHRPGRAGPGQGAQLQQSQRRQCRARAGRRIPRRPADGGRSSSMPIPAASPRATLCSRRGKRRSPATASRRSAESSPSTARSTPRPPRRSPTSSPKSSSRPTPTRTRARSSRARRTCACC